MKRSAVMILTSLLLAGCAGDEQAATTATSDPRPDLAVAAWDGMPVGTICLEGTEVYEDVSGTPIRDMVAAAIDEQDDDEVSARVGSAGCDATITFDLRGRALSRVYTGSASGSMYTGAEIEGTMILTADGREPMSATLSDRIDPPESFTLPEWKEPPGEPAEAPFWLTVEDRVCAAFAGWFEGADLTALLTEIRGSWPPHGEECGGYGESSPFGDLGS